MRYIYANFAIFVRSKIKIYSIAVAIARRGAAASLLAREVDRARKTKLLRHINRIRTSFAYRDGHGTDRHPDEWQRDSIKW